MIKEEELLYNLGMRFSGLAIPQPTDLRTILDTNPEGRNWKERSVADLQGLVIHQALGDYTLEGMAKYHTSEKCHLVAGGVESIAYTIGIRKNGEVAVLNALNKATWSQGCRSIEGDENRLYMAVILEGLFDYEGCIDENATEPTPQQLISLLLLWDYCKGIWGWKAEQLFGHYHFGKKACPGKVLRCLIESIRKGGL